MAVEKAWKIWGMGYSSVVEHLISVGQVLGLMPHPTPKKMSLIPGNLFCTLVFLATLKYLGNILVPGPTA